MGDLRELIYYLINPKNPQKGKKQDSQRRGINYKQCM